MTSSSRDRQVLKPSTISLITVYAIVFLQLVNMSASLKIERVSELPESFALEDHMLRGIFDVEVTLQDEIDVSVTSSQCDVAVQ